MPSYVVEILEAEPPEPGSYLETAPRARIGGDDTALLVKPARGDHRVGILAPRLERCYPLLLPAGGLALLGVWPEYFGRNPGALASSGHDRSSYVSLLRSSSRPLQGLADADLVDEIRLIAMRALGARPP